MHGSNGKAGSEHAYYDRTNSEGAPVAAARRGTKTAEETRKTSQDSSDQEGADPRLNALRKKLEREQAVRKGTENLISEFRKFNKRQELVEAEDMLKESKTKIELIKMSIARVRNETAKTGKGEEIGSQSLGERVDDLKHRICVEWRIAEGARNMLKLTNADKKSINETKERIAECERKLAVLKYSLEKREFELQLIEFGDTAPVPSVDIVQVAAQGATLPPDSMLYRKADPLTGVLKIQLLGCQDVLTCLPLATSRMSLDSSASIEASSSSSKSGRILKGGGKKERKSSEASFSQGDKSGMKYKIYISSYYQKFCLFDICSFRFTFR